MTAAKETGAMERLRAWLAGGADRQADLCVTETYCRVILYSGIDFRGELKVAAKEWGAVVDDVILAALASAEGEK